MAVWGLRVTATRAQGWAGLGRAAAGRGPPVAHGPWQILLV